MSGWLRRGFRLEEKGTSVATEVRAGVVTFLTMAYILLVNPQILSQAGMPADDVVVATGLSAAIATLVMGLYAGFPFALAPGMGLNAYFTFGVVHGMGVSWQLALGAVFVEGLLFLVLLVGGVRSRLLAAFPRPVKLAVMSGIGLFLALIGLQNAGVVVDHPATLLALGDLRQAPVLVALGGLVLTAALMARRVPGAILVGICAATAAAWGLGFAELPARVLSVPSLPAETFLAFDLEHLVSWRIVPVVFAFFFVDVLDTAGTLIGVGRLAGFTDEEGNLPGSERAFTADAVGTTVGAMLGTSTVTTYIESGAGVEEGGRSGLTAVVVALLFLLALFFTPLLAAVPPAATAPALVVVGALMMAGAREVDWSRPLHGIPAFLTVVAMPFTYSIANGIALGVISYAALALLTGRWREADPLLYVLAALLVAWYVLGGVA